jgi:hypothetical protein
MKISPPDCVGVLRQEWDGAGSKAGRRRRRWTTKHEHPKPQEHCQPHTRSTSDRDENLRLPRSFTLPPCLHHPRLPNVDVVLHSSHLTQAHLSSSTVIPWSRSPSAACPRRKTPFEYRDPVRRLRDGVSSSILYRSQIPTSSIVPKFSQPGLVLHQCPYIQREQAGHPGCHRRYPTARTQIQSEFTSNPRPPSPLFFETLYTSRTRWIPSLRPISLHASTKLSLTFDGHHSRTTSLETSPYIAHVHMRMLREAMTAATAPKCGMEDGVFWRDGESLSATWPDPRRSSRSSVDVIEDQDTHLILSYRSWSQIVELAIRPPPSGSPAGRSIYCALYPYY